MNHKILPFFFTSLSIFGLSSCGGDAGTNLATSSSSFSDLVVSSSSEDLGSSSSAEIIDSTLSGWHDFSADNAKLRFVGRGDFTNPLAPSFSWSGASWSIAFQGSALKVKLSAAGSIFNVFVDGDTIPTMVLDLSTSTDTEHLLIEGLPYGNHTVSVFKRTEAQYGDAIFHGFSVFGAPILHDLPPAPIHKIEFIGNSITCGYGNLDSVKEHPFDITTEDHYYTYASVAARAVQAEHHAVCFSGRGIYLNNTGSLDGTLPKLYKQISPNTETLWDFSRWTADVVAINLGTNDFYLGIPDSAGFVNASVTFVKDIRKKYPLAKILMLDGPMLSDYYPNVDPSDFNQFTSDAVKGYPVDYYIRKINGPDTTYTYRSQSVCKRYLNAAKDLLIAQGVANVVRYSFPAQSGSNGYGADWHPSKKQHAVMGDMLAKWLRSEMNW